jgi:hypothetical protein
MKADGGIEMTYLPIPNSERLPLGGPLARAMTKKEGTQEYRWRIDQLPGLRELYAWMDGMLGRKLPAQGIEQGEN